MLYNEFFVTEEIAEEPEPITREVHKKPFYPTSWGQVYDSRGCPDVRFVESWKLGNYAFKNFLVSILGHPTVCGPITCDDERRLRFQIKATFDESVDPTSKENVLHKVLYWPVVDESRQVLDRLLELGMDPNMLDGSGNSPLHNCVILQKVELARSLLLCRANINSWSWNGVGPVELLQECWMENQDAALKPEFSKLAKLAFQMQWSALRGSVRRGAVEPNEMYWDYEGLTASQWCDTYARDDVAAELRFFVSS
ncbi:unnamed protein product [Notodromas monacha]|uniref:Uncharacterized protein n=1 Tax=Notodromas monacha TaxID=399045 RepID=A0A7R9BMR0_9CRUS|nr:unnamed protein product [Notodromas monacha]CAG0918357.1 unnamed protein product [Notodromas monacha]